MTTRSSAGRSAAAALLRQVSDDPRDVAQRCAALLATSEEPGTRSILLRAQGLAARAVSSIDESISLLRRAVTEAEVAGEARLLVEAQLSLSGSLALNGELDAAIDQLNVSSMAPGDLEGRVAFQRGTIRARMGRTGAALQDFDIALPLLKAAGDEFFAAGTHGNRGRLRLEIGDTRAARHDLESAYRAHVDLGQRVTAAYVLHNLGELALVEGDIVGALRLLEESRSELEELTNTPWEPETARCATLLSAGLFREAAELAERLSDLMSDAGLELDRAEALLLLSTARLALRQRAGAHDAADAARQLFSDQDRVSWARRAELALVRAAAPSTGSTGRAHGATAATLADQFDEGGHAIAAAEARAESVLRFVDAGDLEAAADQASVLQRRGAASGRVEHHLLNAYATAFLRARRGDRSGALRAISRAVALADRNRLALGATELALAGANHAAALHQLASNLVVGCSDQRTVLRYTELARSASMRSRPIRRPDHDELADAVGRVRALVRSVERAEGMELRERHADLTTAVRHLRTLERTRTSDLAATSTQASLAQIRGVIGTTTIVSMFIAEDRLVAQVIDRHRARLCDLGLFETWRRGFTASRDLLHMAARGFTVLDAEIVESLAELDGVLSTLPLGPGRILLVPPVELLESPWGLLTRLGDTPFVVTPSIHVWFDRVNRTPSPLALCAVSGPLLEQAQTEVARIAELYSDARVFSGAQATADNTLGGLAGSSVVHLACHGVHRAGNALMSSLTLADGPLLLAQLDRGADTAEVVVLSACHGAEADQFGGETMGFVSTFLNSGASTVIAGAGAIEDTPATVAFMVAFHTSLVAGSPPADALLAARRDSPLAVGGAFNCYGAG